MSLDRIALIGVVALAVVAAILAQTGIFNRPAMALVGGYEMPDLDDPAMIRRGAAHYDRVCARCHASPDGAAAAEAAGLSPPPPVLHERLDGWTPEALFATVRNGVPGTGMPAWPAPGREDEIWSMVAFLRALPALDRATYRALAGVPSDAVATAGGFCTQCHGTDGRGTPDGAFPRLDIQSPEYLQSALAAFRDGRRASGFMQSAVAGLEAPEIRALSTYFGRKVLDSDADFAPASTRFPGPDCTACHGPPAPARPEFPALAGQYEAYLSNQIKLLSDRHSPRGGGPFIPLMHAAAQLLPPATLLARARTFSHLPNP